VQDMWQGTVHSWVLLGVPYKGAIQLDEGEGEAYVYIKKKECKLNFTTLRNNYLELYVHFY
jgi:hypothetical protein